MYPVLVLSSRVGVFFFQTGFLNVLLEPYASDTGAGMLAATNVFEVQDGEWKIIHHHAHGIAGLR